MSLVTTGGVSCRAAGAGTGGDKATPGPAKLQRSCRALPARASAGTGRPLTVAQPWRQGYPTTLAWRWAYVSQHGQQHP